MTAALYPCEITHVRARPIRRTFRYRSYLWLVDLDDLPRVPLPLRPLARFRARDHLGDPAARSLAPAWTPTWHATASAWPAAGCSCSATPGSSATSSTRSPCSGATGADGTPGGGHRRSPQHLRPAARVPAAPGRPRPGGGGQGLLRLTVPAGRRAVPAAPARAGGTLRLGVTLHIDGRPVLAASVTGKRRAVHPAGACSATPSAIRWVTAPGDGAHPLAGHQARSPAPADHSPARPSPTGRYPMTTATAPMPRPSPRRPGARRLPRARQPAVPAVPRGPAALARAAVARAFLSRAAARLPIRVQAPDGQAVRRRRPRVAGPGDPRPGRVLPAAGLRDGRARRGLHGRRLGLRRPGRPVHRARRERGRARARRRCRRCAAGTSRASRPPRTPPSTAPGATSSGTTTCPTTCSPSSSTRR